MNATCLKFAFCLAILFGLGPVLAGDAEDVFVRDVRPFLQRHCYSCHDARKSAAGFRIDQLGTDFRAGRTADLWKEVVDQINVGAMPPEEEPRPDPKRV
jgi:predicted CXXCH cytochrome family protein